MLSHYLKIAFRIMKKHKVQSLAGVLGLTFALVCFIPALYWMRYEMTYDSFYPDSDAIYRIYTVEKEAGKVNKEASKGIEQRLREQYPGIKASTLIIKNTEKCRTDKIPHISLNMLYSDSTFLDVFPQLFICTALTQPLSVRDNIVLTEAMAIRLFGDPEKALGQKIQTSMNPAFPPYTVAAVIKDPPAHTNISFDAIVNHNMIAHFASMPEEFQWSYFFLDLYVKIYPDVKTDSLANDLRDLPSRLELNRNIELRMMPIQDIRHQLNADVPFTLNFISLFVVAGVLLLVSSVFNFLNLYLDLCRQRLRELRLRSVHGASGGQLIRQMMFELICFLLFASLLACYFIFLIRPVFSGLLAIEIEKLPLLSLFIFCWSGIAMLILLIAFVGFLRITREVCQFRSLAVNTEQTALRRMAVTLQLAVSMLFVVAALVVLMQMSYLGHKDLGFKTEGIIQISGFMDPSGRVEKALIQELLSNPSVECVTDAFFEPQHGTALFTMSSEVEWAGKESAEKPVFNYILTDWRFAETFGLTMHAGKWWAEGQTMGIVLNEEAIRVMRLKEPIGRVIKMASQEDISVMQEYTVVGVVNDFHTLSLRNPIQPTIFLASNMLSNKLYIKVASGQENHVCRQITSRLSDIDIALVDARLTPISDLYDHLNRSEQIGLKLFSLLTIVCLFIALCGIYAVAIASTQRRRKEIAIRKVAGANVAAIIHLFFREYTVQVLIAGILSFPLAGFLMTNWLQGYAYRISIPWWLLVVVIVGVVAIVLLTVFGQIWKASHANPAEVVKSE